MCVCGNKRKWLNYFRFVSLEIYIYFRKQNSKVPSLDKTLGKTFLSKSDPFEFTENNIIKTENNNYKGFVNFHFKNASIALNDLDKRATIFISKIVNSKFRECLKL